MDAFPIENVRFLDAAWVAESINGNQETLLLDARPFADFSTSHIVRALHIGQNSIFQRKFQQIDLRVTRFVDLLADILQQQPRFEASKILSIPLVAYDQCSDELGLLNPDSFLYSLLKQLSTEIKPVFVLKGGFNQFRSIYPELCSENVEVLTRRDDPDAPTESPQEDQLPLAAASSSFVVPWPKSLDPPPPQICDAPLEFHHCEVSRSFYSPNSPTITLTGAQSATLIEQMKPSLVLPHLLLGSQSNSMSLHTCQRYGVTHILNVSIHGDKSPHVPASRFYRVAVNDNFTDQILPHFSGAFAFIDQAKADCGRVLIHCSAGISRSPTLAIAYLMQSAKLSLRKAYAMIKAVRPTIAPNFNFLGQLSEFEHELNFANPNVHYLATSLSPTTPSTSPVPLQQSRIEPQRRVSMSAGIKRSASDLPPVLSSLSPKHSQTKKRDRPTYLSLQTQLCSRPRRPDTHSQSVCQSYSKPKSDFSPTEGKRTCFHISPLTCSSSNLVPSPCTVFSCLELSSPVFDRPNTLRTHSPLSPSHHSIRRLSTSHNKLQIEPVDVPMKTHGVKRCSSNENVESAHSTSQFDPKRFRHFSAPSALPNPNIPPTTQQSHLTTDLCQISETVRRVPPKIFSTSLGLLTPNSCTDLHVPTTVGPDDSSSVAFTPRVRSSSSADDQLFWCCSKSPTTASTVRKPGSSPFLIPHSESSCRLEQQQLLSLHRRSSSSSGSSGGGGGGGALSSPPVDHSLPIS